MKIVAVVPMKLNNQRLPKKNTKKFVNGGPLCQYILKTLSNCTKINEIYVYCSESEIKEHLICGIKYLKRDKSLDGDNIKINDVLYSFANDVQADIYVMAHATAPFVNKESIEKGIDAVLMENYDSAFSVKKIQDFIWKDGRPLNYDLGNIPRTQDLDVLYMETSGFYIYRSEIIQNMKRRIGINPYLVEVGEIESCDIDEKEDFIIADAIHYYMKMKREKNE